MIFYSDLNIGLISLYFIGVLSLKKYFMLKFFFIEKD